MKTPWQQAVERVVRSIPRGQTLGYSEVALRAGKPGAARAVVRALHGLDGAPWWRVIRSDGSVAEAMATEQVPRLQKEGVKVVGLRVLRSEVGSRARK